MKDFGFSLAPGTSLRESSDGYFLLSRLPVRLLRVNRPLFRLLEHLRDANGLTAFVARNPAYKEADLLNILLSLTAGGYLKLEAIAEVDDYPCVSIVIPVRDQPVDLAECLMSLAELEYPRDQLEVIVVDDGSKKVVSRTITSDVRIVRLERSLGPATARNIGAEKASGDILAFLDADCTAGERWLRDIVPFFLASKVGAVGGRVAGFYQKGLLDRYEATASSLNMGERLLVDGNSASTFYVPTANMLVRRDIFMSISGFRPGMRVGEDVDFCWRLRDLGHSLLYIPFGAVAHKHRHRLDKMLLRRAQYGASEALLYRLHRDKRKTLQLPVFSTLSFLAIALAVLLLNAYLLCGVPLFFGLDLCRRSLTTIKYKMGISFGQLFYSVLRTHLYFLHFVFFHLLRYYLVLFIGLGILWYPLWILCGLALVYASVVDYLLKRPGLFYPFFLYPFFLFFYLLEHLAYQLGVFWGCLKRGYFGSYLVKVKFT